MYVCMDGCCMDVWMDVCMDGCMADAIDVVTSVGYRSVSLGFDEDEI